MKKVFITYLSLCFFSFAQAQDSTIVTEYNLNGDIPGAVYKYSFVHLTDVHIGESVDDFGTVGYDDTLLSMENGYPSAALMSAVRWINAHATEKDIRFVIVSGDLTDSGEKSEFMRFREIMDELDIPYVPLMGNHDTWPYTKGSNNMEAPEPKGDSIINDIFSPQFEICRSFFTEWNDGSRLNSTYNPEARNFNFLQNFSFQYEGTTFLLTDFNPRYPARFPPGPGIGPEAQLYDFSGGTYRWVDKQLNLLSSIKEKSIIMVSHHPPIREPFGFINAFSGDEYNRLGDLFLPHKEKMGLWLAGHIHRRKSYFLSAKNRDIPIMPVVETASNKEFDNGKFLIVHVYESPVNVGISQEVYLEGMTLFPNPAQEKILVQLPVNVSDAFFTIYDMSGKEQQRTYVAFLDGHYELSLEALGTGKYFLVVTSKEGNFRIGFEKM